jgi:uncharacterized DUF497 family protein
VEFDWDEANTTHIARHGVRPEEALTDPRRLVLRIRSQRGEERWAALGATEAGRILFVVFTRRRAGCGSSPPGTPPPRRSGGTKRGVSRP